jgi:hypothetical protein
MAWGIRWEARHVSEGVEVSALADASGYHGCADHRDTAGETPAPRNGTPVAGRGR